MAARLTPTGSTQSCPRSLTRFHIISLDQRGHGESDWAPDSRYGTEQFASDLLGVMDALGWKRMALVGHSMGGHNAMGFAAWHPERVRMLCVVDSRPSLPEPTAPGHAPAGTSRPAAPRVARPRRSGASGCCRARRWPTPELLEHLGRQGITEREGRFLYRFDPACNGARQPVDGWALLDRITAPTLLVRGELSPIMPKEMADRMLAPYPAPRWSPCRASIIIWFSTRPRPSPASSTTSSGGCPTSWRERGRLEGTPSAPPFADRLVPDPGLRERHLRRD